MTQLTHTHTTALSQWCPLGFHVSTFCPYETPRGDGIDYIYKRSVWFIVSTGSNKKGEIENKIAQVTHSTHIVQLFYIFNILCPLFVSGLCECEV